MRFTPTDAAVLTDVIRAICVALLLAVAIYGFHGGVTWLRTRRCRLVSRYGRCHRLAWHRGFHATWTGDGVWFAWTRCGEQPVGYVQLRAGLVRPLDRWFARELLTPLPGGWFRVDDRCDDPCAAMARVRSGR